MAKKRKEVEAKIKTERDFEMNEVDEQGLYFVVFNGDAVIDDGHITFLENDAFRIYNRIMGELVEDYATAPSLKYKNSVASKMASLTIEPLRLH